MELIKKVLGTRLVWSTGIYAQDQPVTPSMSLPRPWKVLDAKRLDLLGRYPHTYADPFLFVHADCLYIFLEVVHRGRPGEIAAFRTRDLETLEDLGVVLTKKFHLSFPFVFDHSSSIYLVPESKSAGTVSLYRFDRFPFDLREVRTLLKGAFVDTHLFKHEGKWYLFTTSDDKLHLFVGEDLLTGEFRAHPGTPITRDKRISRSGGSILNLGGRLYRVAQDCSHHYGQNISLIEINSLSPDVYKESMAVQNVFRLNNRWDAHGAHHLSVCEFRDKTVIAADGQQRDFFINRLSSLSRLGTKRLHVA